MYLRSCLAISIVCWRLLVVAEQPKTPQPSPVEKMLKHQTTSLSEMFGKKTPVSTGKSLESMRLAAPTFDDAVFWDAPLEILYGATFRLVDADSDDPSFHTVQAIESYEIVENTTPSPLTVVGYCEHSDEGRCQLHEIRGGQIRMDYKFTLQPAQCHTKGLHEAFSFPARLVWVLLEDDKGKQRWRLLNLFHGLQDLYGHSDKTSMTTLVLPKNTFVSLDGSTQEENPSFDVVHYPGQFQSRLSDADFFITRVNPNTPLPVRWAVQQLISAGIASVFWHWILLGLGTLTPVPVLNWVFQKFFRRKKPDARDAVSKSAAPKSDGPKEESKAAAVTA